MMNKLFRVNYFSFTLIKIQRNTFCDWKKIDIPINKIDASFSRSSGAGGQSVNKVNSKVELRFNVNGAEWLTKQIKDRLYELYPNKINTEGEFFLTSQEHRTQEKNKKEAYKKLQDIINIASIPVKEREIKPFEESEELEEKRLKSKKVRSDVKSMRRDF